MTTANRHVKRKGRHIPLLPFTVTFPASHIIVFSVMKEPGENRAQHRYGVVP